MCNLYSITTNQAAITALFRVLNRYVGNLAPMPGVFPRNLTRPRVFWGRLNGDDRRTTFQ
jgi:hypothetical protein